ncbi:cytochrome-c oxidase, cbb3-type subunit III [Wielerella bovis]|uniref:cytochrome-c oxidase, cbb3-type subunit III n=1 Tax=Wielerella bovis TaxID=2917790 RepID=UPI0020184E3F|nr:cytochrome-c oxidase, cbb3-type subunit III [Wielerella bovis]MCG7656518.1 cytochrome-c oxidase, cbb3-type subunit III [Wielerella bovis]MCG7658743.1 cytochrome-c oxidase, cbb3-type subunit III [Wielerella bovis]ULJ69840.1 cytochrome-c oxidase, cbb3-type subunit III [Wielerella bovis]
MESQFTSPFWGYYIIAIVVLSFLYILFLLISQNKIKVKKGEEAQTMGHSWDGIEEYNNPLPRWWFLMFLGTIVFSIGYLIVYPGLGDYKGWSFGGKEPWSQHNQYKWEVEAAEKETGALYAKFKGMKVEDVAKDPAAMTIGQNLFNTYCIQCHGSDAQGSRGFPNLVDTDWIYGGTPEKIHESINKGRIGVMTPWGPQLGEEGVKDAAHYVISLSRKEGFDENRAARGQEIFKANCVACHGDKGQGTMGLAPNLTDDVWLWSGSEKGIIETITSGRHNQMPAWEGFLTEEKMHLLTAYVWGKSHPDGKALPTDTAPQIGTPK